MIPDLAASVPESLAAMTAKMAIAEDPSSYRAVWRSEQGFAAVLARFAAAYDRPERRALASLWSQYYFAALIIPTTVALLLHDRILPVGADEVAVQFDALGQVDRIWLRDAGESCGQGSIRRFDPLVRGHLHPFITDCAALSRLPQRVLWSNAATILAYAVEQLDGRPVVPAARAEARALLEDGGAANPLRRPYRIAGDGACARRVCCLRYRLAGVPRCAGTCPLDHPHAKSVRRTDPGASA